MPIHENWTSQNILGITKRKHIIDNEYVYSCLDIIKSLMFVALLVFIIIQIAKFYRPYTVLQCFENMTAIKIKTFTF